MVINLSDQNSLVTHWMNQIRSEFIQSDRSRFRRNMERVGEVIAYEISKHLNFTTTYVQTSLGEAPSSVLAQEPVLATIIRAGIPLHTGLLNYFDQADSAFIGAYRKHHRDGSFEIEQHYITCPSIHDRHLIIADPMLATGASLILAIENILEFGTPKSIHIATVIACSIGIENVFRKYNDVTIWAGDIDDELTAKGYIVPGLGDAGDLSFGPKV